MKIDDKLKEHVNDPDFFESLLEDIEKVEKPDLKFKMKLELLSYVQPKVKNIDPATTQRPAEINIQFVESSKDDS